MPDHDPLCRWNGRSITIDGSPMGCDCDLIAKVRADERAKLVDAIAQTLNRYATDVEKRADEPDYFGDMTTGQAVGVALAAAEGLVRQKAALSPLDVADK